MRDRRHSCGVAHPVRPRSMPDRAFSALAKKLAADLLRGRHIVLWGRRGSGKTTLLNAILPELSGAHRALSPATSSLDDITRALERAYSNTVTAGLTRRAARSRLWRAADAESGCVLLDHVTRVPSAMKGCAYTWVSSKESPPPRSFLDPDQPVDVDVDLPVDWPKFICRCMTAAQLRSGAIPRESGDVDEGVSDDPETLYCAHECPCAHRFRAQRLVAMDCLIAL